MRQLLSLCFGEFIDRHIMKYVDFTHHSVSFVGSIAHYFAEELESELKSRGLKLGRIIREPIETLVDYHLT